MWWALHVSSGYGRTVIPVEFPGIFPFVFRVGEGAVVVGIAHLLVIKEELGAVCWCVGAFGRSLVTRIHASADVYLSVSFGR